MPDDIKDKTTVDIELCKRQISKVASINRVLRRNLEKPCGQNPFIRQNRSTQAWLGMEEEDIKGSNTILCFFLITFHITTFKIFKAGFLISENVQSWQEIWKKEEDG